MTQEDQENSETQIEKEEIDLQDLVNIVWANKKLVAQVTLISALISVLYSLSLANFYKSESLLVVKTESRSSSLLSQYGGLASLAGINIPSSGADKASEAIEIIQSRAFLNHLLTFKNILPAIMASKNYEDKDKKLILDSGKYDSKTQQWMADEKPSYLDTHEVYIDEIVSISQDKMTGFISISVEHISPIFAQELLSLIIEEANSLLRARDLSQSNKALEYLEIEFAKTSKVEIRESINKLIEGQLETQMMANLDEDYLLVTIEPPFIPEKKAGTARLQITILGSIFGLLISFFIVFFKSRLTFIEKK